jgi:hypothetical protein
MFRVASTGETSTGPASSPSGGGHYRSPGYDTAANRVELHAILGVGQLTIN